MEIFTKRIYDTADENDGFRVLADRLWPRGITKEAAQLNRWAKEIAPSNDLRKWYHGNFELFEEFQSRYLHELRENADFENFLNDVRDHETITLLTSSTNTVHNHLTVLKDFIERQLK